MGAGGLSTPHLHKDCHSTSVEAAEEMRPVIVGLQPAALVDHVARVEWSLLDRIPGDRGGSQQVEVEDLQRILCEVNSHFLPGLNGLSSIRAVAGGSVTNTIRGLAAGFGIPTGIIGACGDDDQGFLFMQNMSFNKVYLSRLRMKKGSTGQMVRDHRSQLIELLKTGNVDLCFANEDEARELIREEPISGLEAALCFLAKYCRWAVVTLGPKGCMANQGKEIVWVPAIGDSHQLDATGAGDLFASGFLYGLVKGLSIEDCCRVGSCCGGAVIRSLSGEVRPENWQWVYSQMKSHGISPPAL